MLFKREIFKKKYMSYYISVLSKATYVLMKKNNEAFFYKCSKCPTVPVPEIRVNLMAQVTEVVENSRTANNWQTTAESCV
jgi:hypothetical protein